MTFTQAIRSGFANYVNFSDRACRSEFWFWVLFTFVASFVLGFIDGFVIAMQGDSPEDRLHVLGTLFSLAVLLPSIAVSIRRLHDIDFKGWWYLIWFTVIGIPVLLIMFCLKGTDGPNRFGPDPLAMPEPDDQGFGNRASV